MKISVIIATILVTQVSASFFDVFQSAVLSVQNSFTKLVSDVVTDVKETVDCTILAVEYVLAVSEEYTDSYHKKCGNKNSGESDSHSQLKSYSSVLDIPIARDDHYLNEELPNEIASKITEKLSKFINSCNHDHDYKIVYVYKELSEETERLANVSDLVKQELNKFSKEIHFDFMSIERKSFKPSVDTILDDLKVLQSIEQNIRTYSDAYEIHSLIHGVLYKLHEIESAESKQNFEVDGILKDLERTSTSSYNDMLLQIEGWKSDKARHLNLINSKMEEHDKLREQLEYIKKNNTSVAIKNIHLEQHDDNIQQNTTALRQQLSLNMTSNTAITLIKAAKERPINSKMEEHEKLRERLENVNNNNTAVAIEKTYLEQLDDNIQQNTTALKQQLSINVTSNAAKTLISAATELLINSKVEEQEKLREHLEYVNENNTTVAIEKTYLEQLDDNIQQNTTALRQQLSLNMTSNTAITLIKAAKEDPIDAKMEEHEKLREGLEHVNQNTTTVAIEKIHLEKLDDNIQQNTTALSRQSSMNVTSNATKTSISPATEFLASTTEVIAESRVASVTLTATSLNKQKICASTPCSIPEFSTPAEKPMPESGLSESVTKVTNSRILSELVKSEQTANSSTKISKPITIFSEEPPVDTTMPLVTGSPVSSSSEIMHDELQVAQESTMIPLVTSSEAFMNPLDTVSKSTLSSVMTTPQPIKVFPVTTHEFIRNSSILEPSSNFHTTADAETSVKAASLPTLGLDAPTIVPVTATEPAMNSLMTTLEFKMDSSVMSSKPTTSLPVATPKDGQTTANSIDVVMVPETVPIPTIPPRPYNEPIRYTNNDATYRTLNAPDSTTAPSNKAPPCLEEFLQDGDDTPRPSATNFPTSTDGEATPKPEPEPPSPLPERPIEPQGNDRENINDSVDKESPLPGRIQAQRKYKQNLPNIQQSNYNATRNPNRQVASKRNKYDDTKAHKRAMRNAKRKIKDGRSQRASNNVLNKKSN